MSYLTDIRIFSLFQSLTWLLLGMLYFELNLLSIENCDSPCTGLGAYKSPSKFWYCATGPNASHVYRHSTKLQIMGRGEWAHRWCKEPQKTASCGVFYWARLVTYSQLIPSNNEHSRPRRLNAYCSKPWDFISIHKARFSFLTDFRLQCRKFREQKSNGRRIRNAVRDPNKMFV